MRLARAVRTELVLIAEITSLDDLLTFDLQLVDARTGYVVHGDSVRGIAQSDVEREGVPAVKRMLGFVPIAASWRGGSCQAVLFAPRLTANEALAFKLQHHAVNAGGDTSKNRWKSASAGGSGGSSSRHR